MRVVSALCVLAFMAGIAIWGFIHSYEILEEQERLMIEAGYHSCHAYYYCGPAGFTVYGRQLRRENTIAFIERNKDRMARGEL